MAGKMGDRVERSRPEGIDERKTTKKRETGEGLDHAAPKKRKVISKLCI